MRKPSKRNVTVPSSSASKPVPAVAAVAATPKPVAAKTAPKASPAVPAAIPAAVAAAAVPATDTAPRGLTRDAAGIVRYATNFAQYSDRDTAYLAFFGTVCRNNGGAANLRQIHDAGTKRNGENERKRYNPNYSGSGKATDVGAINRLCKAGYFTRSPDGNTITATALALSNSAYRGTKA